MFQPSKSSCGLLSCLVADYKKVSTAISLAVAGVNQWPDKGLFVVGSNVQKHGLLHSQTSSPVRIIR